MNIKEINTAADMIIRSYPITLTSSRDAIDAAVAAYCDHRDATRTDMLRIRTRIESLLNRD